LQFVVLIVARVASHLWSVVWFGLVVGDPGGGEMVSEAGASLHLETEPHFVAAYNGDGRDKYRARETKPATRGFVCYR